jgi:hypothetical protein
MPAQLLSLIFGQWWLVIISSYAVLWAVQAVVIFPLEDFLFHNGIVASYLFLPHAVRVLGAWLYGPKVVFPLFVISLLCHMQLVDKSIVELTPLHLLSVLAGVICAPLTLEFMKLMRIDVYPKDQGIISWRTLIFVGVVSSIVNSMLNTISLAEYFNVENTISVLFRYVVGDVMGLFLVLLLLVFASKKIRGASRA